MDNLIGDWSLSEPAHMDAFFAGAFLLGFLEALRPCRLAMSPTIFLSICMVVLEIECGSS